MIKVLILGGGFGGISCALSLEKRLKKDIKSNKIQITVIDKNNYHLFVTSLYEVASVAGVKKDPFAVRLKKSVCIPHADIFEHKHINYIQAEITEVNIEAKYVLTKAETKHEFDYLVLALGSKSNDFNIPGVEEYAYKFKFINDALMISDRIESIMKELTNGKKSTPVSILIGGAGFTGIELASELACCTQSIARKCGLKGRCSSLVLFEAMPQILPMASSKERKIILNRLTKHGVMVMTNATIEEVGDSWVKLKTGQKINGDLVIWTAGIRANDLVHSIKELPLSEKYKIQVEPSLAVKGLSNIFAIGDIAEFIDPLTKRPIPAMAFVAHEEGAIVAKNIYNSIKNRKYKSYYQPSYNIWIAPVGGKFAVAHLWDLTISGFWGWVIRELIDLRYMLQILPMMRAFAIFWEEFTLFIKND